MTTLSTFLVSPSHLFLGPLKRLSKVPNKHLLSVFVHVSLFASQLTPSSVDSRVLVSQRSTAPSCQEGESLSQGGEQ